MCYMSLWIGIYPVYNSTSTHRISWTYTRTLKLRSTNQIQTLTPLLSLLEKNSWWKYAMKAKWKSIFYMCPVFFGVRVRVRVHMRVFNRLCVCAHVSVCVCAKERGKKGEQVGDRERASFFRARARACAQARALSLCYSVCPPFQVSLYLSLTHTVSHAHTHACTCAQVCATRTHARARACTHAGTHTRTHAPSHTHTHARTLTRTRHPRTNTPRTHTRKHTRLQTHTLCHGALIQVLSIKHNKAACSLLFPCVGVSGSATLPHIYTYLKNIRV